MEEKLFTPNSAARGMQVEEILKLFSKDDVRYLLIGGQAIRLEGFPRFSMDWDIYIPPRDLENIQKINTLLGDMLDIPLEALGDKGECFVQTYQIPFGILQFHLGGPGLPPFEDAFKLSVLRKTESGLPVRCLCSRHLLESKKAANRPQDQVDIEFLEEKLKAGKQ